MSYEILYKIFTIRKNDFYIPFVVMGSNNCFEYTGRRERNLYKADDDFFFKKKDYKSIEDLKAGFKFEKIQKFIDEGNLQGKYKSAKSILNSFIIKLIDISELDFKPKLVNLYYANDLTKEDKNLIEQIFSENVGKSVLSYSEEQEFNKSFLEKLPTEIRTKLLSYITYFISYHYSDNEYSIDRVLKQMTKPRKKQKTAFEINEELKNVEFVDVDKMTDDDFKKIANKQILVYDKFKNLSKKGKIKQLSNGDYGFFEGKNKRTYYYLINFKYLKIIKR